MSRLYNLVGYVLMRLSVFMGELGATLLLSDCCIASYIFYLGYLILFEDFLNVLSLGLIMRISDSFSFSSLMDYLVEAVEELTLLILKSLRTGCLIGWLRSILVLTNNRSFCEFGLSLSLL